MKIKFLGAAGTVTGSKTLVEHQGKQILIDCGIYQGVKQNRLRNWAELPVDLKELDAILLTHAHIDHSGYIPVVTKAGYKGPIYATAPTRDLCAILLPDCGYLQEEDARYANEKGFSKHKPALPLYTEQDGRDAIKSFQVVEHKKAFEIGKMRVTFREAGHILGASNITIETDYSSILFSGDVGRYDDLLEHAPKSGPGAHSVVMESTYGDRLHPDVDPIQAIGEIVSKTVDRGGVLVIPSFAVGRAQTLMFAISEVFRLGLSKTVPVFLNSPMANRVTELYKSHQTWHGLSEEQCRQACSLAKPITSVEDSKLLHKRKGPMIIISASGMLTGGRVLHHIAHFGTNPNNTILLAGFQAPGTRGAILASGSKRLKMHGIYIDIKAEVNQLHCLSAHADQSGLIHWLKNLGQRPETVYLNHGEPQPLDQLRLQIEEQIGSKVVVPGLGDTFQIN